MIDKFNNIFYLQMPTNVNSLINTVGLVLRHYDKNTSVTIDDIKNKSREMFLLDYHVFYMSYIESFKKHKGYWIKRLSRIMNVYRLYLEDMTRMFGCDGIKTFEDDIEYTINKIFGVKIKISLPEVKHERMYDHDYITKYVTEGENDVCFDIYCAIAADELDKYIPRVYGTRMQKFTSVENRAGVNLVLPFTAKKCLELLWLNDKNDTKKLLHDIMWLYFDDNSIENLINYLYNHVKGTPRYGILCNNKDQYNILNNDQYTTVGGISNLEYCKYYLTEFMKIYACS